MSWHLVTFRVNEKLGLSVIVRFWDTSAKSMLPILRPANLTVRDC